MFELEHTQKRLLPTYIHLLEVTAAGVLFLTSHLCHRPAAYCQRTTACLHCPDAVNQESLTRSLVYSPITVLYEDRMPRHVLSRIRNMRLYFANL